MLAPRWRKVVRDLTSTPTRSLLVMLSIAVGVFAIGSVGGARAILGNDLAATYDAAHDSSASINASDIDASFVRSIARMPEIRSADGRSGILLRVRRPDGSRSNMVNAETDVLPRLAAILDALQTAVDAVDVKSCRPRISEAVRIW